MKGLRSKVTALLILLGSILLALPTAYAQTQVQSEKEGGDALLFKELESNDVYLSIHPDGTLVFYPSNFKAHIKDVEEILFWWKYLYPLEREKALRKRPSQRGGSR